MRRLELGQQFDDLHVLTIENMTWSKPANGSGPDTFGPQRWNHTAVSTFAVPFWKVFVFGGNSGDLVESGNPQGTYLSDMLVLETGDMTWARYEVTGDVPPARSRYADDLRCGPRQHDHLRRVGEPLVR